MIGTSHEKIAELVARHVAEPWRGLMSRYWYAVEIGLEVPDRFMIWHRDPGPPASAGKVPSKLVHRQYLDAESEPRGELISMIWMYTEGLDAFVRALADDEDMRDQTQDMVLYTGALIHFMADLCTPMHVGCSLSEELRSILGDRHHQKIEARLWSSHKTATVDRPRPAPACELSKSWLLGVATETHRDYLALPQVLGAKSKEPFRALAVRALDRSVSTAVAWLDTMAADPGFARALHEVADADPDPR